MLLLTNFKDSLRHTWKYSLLLWLCVWLVGYIGYVVFPIQHEHQGFPWFRESGLYYSNTINNLWDTIFLHRIGTNGYHTIQDHTGNLDYLFAFFPAVPSIIGVLTIFVGSIFSPMLYSLICIMSLGAVVRSVSNTIFGESEMWKWFYVVPFSLFIFVPYTEGIFVLVLLMILGMLYTQQKPTLATHIILVCLGTLGVLTRSVTILFSISIFAVGLVYWIRSKRIEDKFFFINSICVSIGSTIGLAVVILVNQIGSGQWNTFLLVQAYWGRTIGGGRFWDPISRAISETISGNISFSLLCLVGFMGVYVIVFFIKPIYIKYAKMYWISLLFSVLITYTTVSQNTLQSINRYLFATPVILILVPYVLEAYLPKRFETIVYIVGLLFLLFTAGLFFRHYWVG